MEALVDRPPYVTFEEFEEEDREATIENGHLCFKFVDMAYITPQGSKDRIQRKVSDWFPHLEFEVAQQRFKPEWLAAYKEAYKAYKAGLEPPVNGTDLRTFPLISKLQLKACQGLNVKSLEDLASCNEETLMRLGMGARELKAKAVTYLDNAKGAGAVAEQFQALKAKLDDLTARNESLEAQIIQLKGQAQQQTAQGSFSEEDVNVGGIKAADILGF